jgi:hypothetical protein
VRPDLEFLTQVWSPWSVTDKDRLEKAQKDYEEKLRDVGLLALEERRNQADVHLHITQDHAQRGWAGCCIMVRAGTNASCASRCGAYSFNIKVQMGRLELQ